MICISCNIETKNYFHVVGGLTAMCVDCELKLREKAGESDQIFFHLLQKQFDFSKDIKVI